MIKGAGAGMLDDVAVNMVATFEKEFLAFMAAEFGALVKELQDKKSFSDDGEKKFAEAVARFRTQFKSAHKT